MLYSMLYIVVLSLLTTIRERGWLAWLVSVVMYRVLELTNPGIIIMCLSCPASHPHDTGIQ